MSLLVSRASHIFLYGWLARLMSLPGLEGEGLGTRLCVGAIYL